MLSFKNQLHVTLVNTFYNINWIKSVNECHVPLIFKRYHAVLFLAFYNNCFLLSLFIFYFKFFPKYLSFQKVTNCFSKIFIFPESYKLFFQNIYLSRKLQIDFPKYLSFQIVTNCFSKIFIFPESYKLFFQNIFLSR